VRPPELGEVSPLFHLPAAAAPLDLPLDWRNLEKYRRGPEIRQQRWVRLMTYWWEFGEHTGYEGNELSLFRVACAFCNTKGNFERVHREQKKHATSRKILNFDTYKCSNCGNFIMIFWSGSEFASPHTGIHDFRTVPWDLRGFRPYRRVPACEPLSGNPTKRGYCMVRIIDPSRIR
jgi:hypothetical protein